MAAGPIEFKWVPDLKIVANGFNTAGTSIKSFKEPLDKCIREVMKPSIARNFDAQGRPGWVPLANYTIKKKSQMGARTAILQESGRLASKAPLIKNWTVDGTNGTATLNRIEVPYGIYHQTGFYNAQHQTQVPARPWAVIQPEDAERIEDIFQEWIEERIDRDIAFGRINF